MILMSGLDNPVGFRDHDIWVQNPKIIGRTHLIANISGYIVKL